MKVYCASCNASLAWIKRIPCINAASIQVSTNDAGFMVKFSLFVPYNGTELSENDFTPFIEQFKPIIKSFTHRRASPGNPSRLGKFVLQVSATELPNTLSKIHSQIDTLLSYASETDTEEHLACCETTKFLDAKADFDERKAKS